MLASTCALAQEGFPSRPLRLVVPFAAGGGADAVARALAQQLQERLGQPCLVDNRPGGAGNIGTEVVARAVPDGHTLLLTGPSHVNNAFLFSALPFDPRAGFAPVSLLTAAPYVLVAAPSLPARDLPGLLALARAAAPPLAYGSAGNGTAGHLAMELVKTAAQIDLQHVPYRGSPALLTDLMAGRVAVAFDNILSSAPAIAAGQLRALAVSGSHRVAALPEVPTMAEAALPGFDVIVWQGVLAPAGTPPEIVQRVAAGIAQMLALPEVKERCAVLGFEPVGSTPEAFRATIETQLVKWADVIRRGNIRLD